MMKTLRKLLMGYVLLILASYPYNVDAQHLTLTSKGQLTVRPDGANVIDMFMCIEFLPQYKPYTKSVTITKYFLENDAGDLIRRRGGGTNHTKLFYDEQGRITKINDFVNLTFLYEGNRVVECIGENGLSCKFRYDSHGHLESAMKGSWTYLFSVDKKGNITSINEYYGSRKTSCEISISYDSKDRIIAYHEVGADYRHDYCWNYNSRGSLVSYRRTDYKKKVKDTDYEYRFEYGVDGNPIRCIKYIHGDITIIDYGYEYSYDYTFYPDPKEQERKEALRKKEQKKRDSIQLVNQRRSDSLRLVTQRKNDSINLENQRKEALRQERNKELFQVCKYLFDSNEEYESCVVKKNDIIEQDIKGRVVKKLQYIYPLVLNGKELRKEKQPGRNELIQICNMCAQLNILKSQCDNEEIEIINHICDYTESKLGDFVSGRSALNKAYKKASSMSYSSFLLSYMNDK